jgi:hypothetical protein
VRRQENRQLAREGDHRLKGSRYFWLANAENLDESFRDAFAASKHSDLKVSRAWAIKELFRDFWGYRARGWEAQAFQQMVQLGHPQSVNSDQKGSQDFKAVPGQPAQLLRIPDYECGVGGDEFQDKNCEVECTRFSLAPRLQSQHPVLLRWAGYGPRGFTLIYEEQ